jgi:hypothetical protein
MFNRFDDDSVRHTQKYVHRPFVREIREGDDVRCFSTCLEGCKKGADIKRRDAGDLCVDALLEECTPGTGENFQRSPDQKSGENGTRELRRREKRINTSAETGGAAAAAFLHFVRLPFYYMRTEENAHFYCKLLAVIRAKTTPFRMH